MPPIRILVVDDSVVIRKVLSDTLNSDPDLQVVGSAGDGRIGLAKLALLQPDLVTLDIEMPVMNGLQTLAELRKTHPKLPVIMFSTLTERGASATLDALSLGASDYAAKPSNAGGPELAMDAIRADLIPKIKALCRSGRQSIVPRVQPQPPPPKPTNHRIEIVAIGTSTGGPNALAEVLPTLPEDFLVPIVIVQHMPPVFTRMLADRLASRCQIPVAEGSAGVSLKPGEAWIAPGNFHMTLRGSLNWALELNQNPPEHSCRPAVDVLFRSVAQTCRAGVLAVVLTGMGADGVKGAEAIRKAGGQVLVQDEASSVVWGMPGLVFAAGQSDGVYPLQQIGSEIARRVFQSRALKQASALSPANGVSS